MDSFHIQDACLLVSTKLMETHLAHSFVTGDKLCIYSTLIFSVSASGAFCSSDFGLCDWMHVSQLSMYVALTYQRGVSDGHAADDQCVSSQRVLGQLGVRWVVQVCGL